MVISERTKAYYVSITKKYADMLDTPPDKIYKQFKHEGKSLSYIKTVLCAFKWQTGRDEYSIIINKINGEIAKKRKYKNKFAKIDWSKLDEPTGYTVDDVIKGLYMYFPPRRLDYAYMVYVIDEPDTIDEMNYYVRTTKKFIFGRYKTVKKYGTQVFTVPTKLRRLIHQYVDEQHIEPGDNLLCYHGKKNKFSESTLKRKLKKIFGTSVDGLRHAYITHLYKNRDNLFEIEKTSLKMAHDIRTHLTYLDRDNK